MGIRDKEREEKENEEDILESEEREHGIGTLEEREDEEREGMSRKQWGEKERREWRMKLVQRC